MQEPFLSFNFGHLITLAGVFIAWWNVRVTQRTNDEARKVQQQIRDRELAEDIQRRHDENRDMLTNIRIKVEGLAHLDPCIDELKEAISELRKEFTRCIQGNRWKPYGEK